MKIEIKKTEERRQVAAILFSNGYTVREVKEKKGKTTAIYLEAKKEESTKIEV